MTRWYLAAIVLLLAALCWAAADSLAVLTTIAAMMDTLRHDARAWAVLAHPGAKEPEA